MPWLSITPSRFFTLNTWLLLSKAPIGIPDVLDGSYRSQRTLSKFFPNLSSSAGGLPATEPSNQAVGQLAIAGTWVFGSGSAGTHWILPWLFFHRWWTHPSRPCWNGQSLWFKSGYVMTFRKSFTPDEKWCDVTTKPSSRGSKVVHKKKLPKGEFFKWTRWSLI